MFNDDDGTNYSSFVRRSNKAYMRYSCLLFCQVKVNVKPERISEESLRCLKENEIRNTRFCRKISLSSMSIADFGYDDQLNECWGCQIEISTEKNCIEVRHRQDHDVRVIKNLESPD